MRDNVTLFLLMAVANLLIIMIGLASDVMLDHAYQIGGELAGVMQRYPYHACSVLAGMVAGCFVVSGVRLFRAR